jgi:hypothetical protein
MNCNWLFQIFVFCFLCLNANAAFAQTVDLIDRQLLIKDYKCEYKKINYSSEYTYFVSGTLVNRGENPFKASLRIKLVDQDNDIVFQTTFGPFTVGGKNGQSFSGVTSNGTCANKKVLISIETDGKQISGMWENGKLLPDENLAAKITSSDNEKLNTNADPKSKKVIRFELKPNQIRNRVINKDAVAIIIGIQNYRRLAKADFADQDATKFADYANRALGIPKDKIKVLTDADADQAALLKTFRNWLPLNVTKGKTEVFVFYSGHGLPSNDGKSLYFLPHGVDQDLLDETAIDQKKIISAIQSTQPKSVTMFVDSCYSGQSRNGSQLLAGAKPVILKNSDLGYPPEFTVFTASASDQISSASNDLQHGIFSFYLMKGMEGAADINKDGNITFGEMLEYLNENVQRQALAANRVQVPQLIGDPNRILMGM